MLDRDLEPDNPIEEVIEIDEPYWLDDKPTQEEIDRASFNYECMIYREPERRIGG